MNSVFTLMTDVLKMYKGTLICFSAIVTKGGNFCSFLFASRDNVVLLKWGVLFKS